MLKSACKFLAAALLCGSVALNAFAQGEPFRLGFLTVRTGALAAGGAQMEQGILLFLKERNYTLAGRKVELTIADTGGNPAQAKTRTQRSALTERLGGTLLGVVPFAVDRDVMTAPHR